MELLIETLWGIILALGKYQYTSAVCYRLSGTTAAANQMEPHPESFSDAFAAIWCTRPQQKVHSRRIAVGSEYSGLWMTLLVYAV